MDLKIGPPVSGTHFYRRPDIAGRLRKALARGHVSSLAPRRTGKTSLLLRLRDTAAEDHPHFFINLERCTSPAEMVTTLVKAMTETESRWRKTTGAIWGKLKRSLEKLESVTVGPAGVTFAKDEKAWREPAEIFLTELLSHDGPITFLLDEFPILVDAAAKKDPADCEAMLRWFREWRQRTAETEIRFLVTGSVGLDNVVRRHDFADTVNDFDTVDLPPLAETEAIDLTLKLGRSVDLHLSEDHARQMLALIGNSYPYFLQIFVAELDDKLSHPNDRKEIPSDIIEDLYHQRLIAGPRNKYLPHMWDRLDKAFTKAEARMARVILRAVSVNDDGLNGEQLAEAARQSLSQSDSLDPAVLGYVLEVLKHDGYLLQDSRAPYHTRFFSNLLRDYWLRRHA